MLRTINRKTLLLSIYAENQLEPKKFNAWFNCEEKTDDKKGVRQKNRASRDLYIMSGSPLIRTGCHKSHLVLRLIALSR